MIQIEFGSPVMTFSKCQCSALYNVHNAGLGAVEVNGAYSQLSQLTNY